MRDIAITLIVLTGCLYTLKRPYVGILLWSWLSYMNPHRLAYGFAYNMPYALITAIILISSAFLSKETRKLPINGLTITWVIFVLFMGITTLSAYFPELALIDYIRTIKIQFISLLTIMLINDIKQIRQLIWVIVLSIGYYSVKGGIFTIGSGGAYRIWGPESSFIEDNNCLAVAVLMILPLMIYLFQTAQNNLIKRGLIIAIILSFFTVLGSQSRGALVSIATVGGFYWLKSERKIISGVIILIISVILLSFMPESWYKRMNTIQTYEEDTSAMGRINAWEYAYNAANHRLLGMGFNSWTGETFALYAPNPNDPHAAHSIYFSVLGDHGWIGLLLFLMIFIMAWNILNKNIKKTNDSESLKEINSLSKMIKVSFIAYFSGGAFLSLSYFDLPWHLVSIVLIIQRILSEELEKREQKTGQSSKARSKSKLERQYFSVKLK